MKFYSISNHVLALTCAAGISVIPCQASPADDAADAARMAAQANLSFEQAAGPETQYVIGFNRDQRLPWVSLLGGRKDWPAGWVVRNLTDNEGKRTLVLPKREEVKTASAPFALVEGAGRDGSKALQITGDSAGRVFTMGEVGFPVIPLRNYFKGKEIEIELKGWVKGEDANAADQSRVGLEFSQHSELKHGSRVSSVERIPTGTFDWTPISVKAKVQPEAGRWVRIMIDAAGNTGKLSFDDFSLTINGEDAFAFLAKLRDWRDGTTANARLQATLPESVIWTEDPSQKVFGWSRPPERAASPGIELSAAKGEYESFQIAFQPLKDLENITVAFSDLQGPRPWYFFGRPVIPKAQLEIREVALVKRPQQWDFIDHTGMIPDPLRSDKSFTFKAGASRSLWVTVHVPQDTPAGEYSGSIKIGGPLNVDMPIKLKVRNFALPELTSFNLNAEVKPRAIALYDKRPWLEVMRDYFPDMAAHRARVTNFEIFPIPVVKDGKVSLDPASLAESDATMDYAKSLGFHTFTTSKSPFYLGGAAEKNNMAVNWKDTPWAAQKFDAGVSRADPEFPRIYGDYLNLTANHYREKGTLGNVLQYIFDEPFLWAKTPEQKQMVNQFYAISKKAGYRNLLTTSPSPDYTDIDVWCPLYHHAIGHKEEVENAKKAGQSVIWYHNEFYTTNRSTLNARLVGWFTWRYQFDAYLIWSINYWVSGNPWEESKIDGDGYLIYPNPAGEGKPCSSIRWEMMREGIEDYDYFVILKNRADAVLGNATSSPEQTAKANKALKLLKEMEDLIPNDSTTLKYNQNPVDYADLRERIAAAIEALNP
ncbi:MAG: glycoside hydrolase domain-containing protein [Verrucomicrobiota bacterium]